MQKKLVKNILIIFIIMLFGLNISVQATNEANLDDLIVGEGVNDVANDPIVGDEENDEENEMEEIEETEEEETIGSTITDATSNNIRSQSKNNYGTSSYVGQQTSQPTTSYSTVATIPEANLSLNNILNVILIAVGVIIILLAIAILIRLK